MVNKTMEALIGKVKSELNEESKDELLKLITGLNYTEIQDDPVFYLIVKQLEIATKIATYSK
ncbi:MAG TPA: hypothetical protein ENN12_03775, partial [Epsilonproteobacteria bacterium]|nr:hypothetical protein [Campylobacterota bacterium]